jgi:hypothetical protein
MKMLTYEEHFTLLHLAQKQAEELVAKKHDRYSVSYNPARGGADTPWIVTRRSPTGLKFTVSEHSTRARARIARRQHLKAYREARGLSDRADDMWKHRHEEVV